MSDQAFEAEIRAMLGDQAEAFFESQQKQSVRALRPRPGIGLTVFPGVTGETVPWNPEMLYLAQDSLAGKDPLHEAGAYYIQEPSAVIPALVLDPAPGQLVLDLCAAPGGKTTQLSLAKPGITLIANEINPKRAQVLASNVARMGCVNTVVISEPPDKLARLWGETFDAILVDAPCSGEGMFRKDKSAVEEWSPVAVDGCAKRQKGILDCASMMLKPGGVIVYSTCTFNRKENDLQIEDFLSTHRDFYAEAFTLPTLGTAQDGMLHIWPHQYNCEGHFVARLRKKGQSQRSLLPLGGLPPLSRADAQALSHLMNEVLAPPVGLTVNCSFKQAFYSIPEQLPDLSRIHILQPGLQTAVAQGTQLRPAHALSHAYAALYCHDATAEEVARYLHGEPLEDDALPASCWCAVTYRRCALGWGKKSDGVIKNHYPKGLRQ